MEFGASGLGCLRRLRIGACVGRRGSSLEVSWHLGLRMLLGLRCVASRSGLTRFHVPALESARNSEGGAFPDLDESNIRRLRIPLGFKDLGILGFGVEGSGCCVWTPRERLQDSNGHDDDDVKTLLIVRLRSYS